MAAFPTLEASRQVPTQTHLQRQLAQIQPGHMARGNRFTHPTEYQSRLLDREMVRFIWQHGFMSGRKFQGLEDIGTSLSRDKISLNNEIVQTKEMLEKEWPLHVKRVRADVEMIYTKFKALNEEIKQERLELEGPSQSAKLKRLNQEFQPGKAEAEIDAKFAVCNLYHYSLRFFFLKVEGCHQKLVDFPEAIQQEQEPSMPKEASKDDISEVQERTLEHVSDGISVFFEELKRDFQAQIGPLQQAKLDAEEEVLRLQCETMELKGTYLKTRHAFHSYLRQQLTLPTEQDYAYKNLRDCRLAEKPDPAVAKKYEYFFHYQTKVVEQAEKILPQWDEIASLITTLLNSLSS